MQKQKIDPLAYIHILKVKEALGEQRSEFMNVLSETTKVLQFLYCLIKDRKVVRSEPTNRLK